MARGNFPFLAFNRGILSPKALARVDLDRTKLSAEVMTNWLPKSQGAMSIRPGTKYLGSSYGDTGAEYLEFVAATDDTALVELTHQKMRIWIDDALLERPSISTTLSVTDTGWSSTSTGGTVTSGSAGDQIPAMTDNITAGVTISASSQVTLSSSFPAWRAADNNVDTRWQDTGNESASTLPSWWKVDFGAGNTKAITSYTLRSENDPVGIDNAPNAWTLQCNDVDTGAGWTTVDSRTGVTGWAVSERRSYTRLDADTGTVEAFRYWRLNFTASNGTKHLNVAEIEMFAQASALQVQLQGGSRYFNPMSFGALARMEKP